MSSTERIRSRLGDLTVSQDSRRRPVKSTERNPGPYPYYGASGIVDYVDSFIFEGLHLLIAEDGENLRSRNTPVAFLADGQFWVNNHAHVLQGNSLSDTRYLAYAVEQLDLSGYLTGSTQPKLTKGALDSVMLDVPPLAEQQAIAEVLGALDDKIAANTALTSTTWDLMETEFRLVQSGPDHARTTLGAIASFEYGKALPASARESGDVSVIGSGGPSGFHSAALVDHPGVVVGRKGSAGSVHWVSGPHFPIDTTFYVRGNREGISQPYLYFLLRTLRLNEMNNDSAVPGLNRSEALALPVMLPAAERINNFTGKAETQIALVEVVARENRTLAATRDLLLPQLMSGKLRVREAETIASAAGA
ncbi:MULTISPECIES: restriction endonuclease subunit S [unclassified Microbacterium]